VYIDTVYAILISVLDVVFIDSCTRLDGANACGRVAGRIHVNQEIVSACMTGGDRTWASTE
jgi:hypothetical protein